MDGHIAILGIHANGDPVAVFFQHPGGKVKIRHRHAAQDAAAHAEGEVFFNALLGADAAAHLNIQAALLCQRGNGIVVGKSAVLRAVQIDDVQVFCPRSQKLPRLCAGVLAVDGHAVIVTLGQAHHLAAAQVNGWKQLHRKTPFTFKMVFGLASSPSPSTRTARVHLSQRERPWQYDKVSGFAKGSHFGGAGIASAMTERASCLTVPQTPSRSSVRCLRSFPGGTGCHTPCPPAPHR